jgi:PPP family 3-phenylpropionic acid transporter
MGGTLGGVLSGLGWETLGPSWTFTSAACCAMLGYILFCWLMPRENQR